jgi:protein tyrosine phosphatase (PTP) superfamily phosphohydrolase (DUF442 family)
MLLAARSLFASVLCGPALALALLAGPRPEDGPVVENFHEVGSDLCVGGEPVGDRAFRGLAERGVRTVVTVDGAKPDVATARKYGLRYVHIPIGYDGVPAEAGLALARVARDCDGPVYVHCHHGKHRGPAAAAVIGIACGRLDHESAIHLLEQAGTSRDYAGLWRDVAVYVPPPENAKLPELVETAEVDTLAVSMAEIDHVYDRLKAIEGAGWRTPADQPDLVPRHEATLLLEAFRESARLLPPDRAALKPGLTAAEGLAAELTEALKTGDSPTATAKLAALKATCTACHRQHRDGG